MAKLSNRVRFTTATTGTGTITVAAAVSGFRLPAADANLADGDVVSYFIADGTAWEHGTGALGSTKTTMTRVLRESSSGALLTLTGSAEVFLSPGRPDLEKIFKVLTANAAYSNATGAQPWFPTAGAVTLPAGTAYRFEGLMMQTNGTTSHTVGLSFGGTATLTSIAWRAHASAPAVGGTATSGNVTFAAVATNIVATAAITTAGTVIHVTGVVRINAGGTFIPQFTFSAAPGGGNILANTFFELREIGHGSVVSNGTWA